MTQEDAEKIVLEYGSVLETKNAPAEPASQLPVPAERIVQAMKLCLARDIQKRSLTEEFRNAIGHAAWLLPLFIEDAEARRLNTMSRSLTPEERFLGEVDEWKENAMIAGLSLRAELRRFIAAVEQFDPAESLFGSAFTPWPDLSTRQRGSLRFGICLREDSRVTYPPSGNASRGGLCGGSGQTMTLTDGVPSPIDTSSSRQHGNPSCLLPPTPFSIA